MNLLKMERLLHWRKPMSEFADKTGRPDLPPGKQEIILMDRIIILYTGVSWYEAAAYAEFAGKRPADSRSLG